MKKINKFGLYKTNVPRHKIAGLKSDVNDEQTQGWWIPLTNKNGDVYMVDTYHINSGVFSFRNPVDSFIRKVSENSDFTYTINRANADYYYGGSLKVTDETIDYFEEVCDLRNFKVLYNDKNDYKKSDIVEHVQLWFEHGYPNGVTLVRRGAEKDEKAQIRNIGFKMLNDIDNNRVNSFYIDELVRLSSLCTDEDSKKEANELINLAEKINILSQFQSQYVLKYNEAVGYRNKNDKELLVIAVAGKAGIGKSTVSDILRKKLFEINPMYRYTSNIIPLAEEIKLQAKLLGWDGKKDEKGRKLLQDLTKPIKAYHGQDYYANIVLEKAKARGLEICIVDDLRFKSEIEVFKKAAAENKINLITAKVVNDDFVSSLSKEAQADISENDLNDYEFDYVIDNSQTLELLEEKAKSFIEELSKRFNIFEK